MKKVIISPLILLAIFGVFILSCEPDVPPVDPPVSDATDLWENSAHADTTSMAFTYWDNNTPPEIPERCAKCHSTEGFIDFIGSDGSTEGVVDKPVEVGHGTNNINCLVCHDETDALRPISRVKFPSGIEIETTSNDAACLNCHQGTRSGLSVDTAVADLGAGEDVVSENLSFINIHYSVAGAIQYGSEVKAGFEYPSENYTGKFGHVENWSSCIECHNPHSLEVDLNSCNFCHPAGVERFKTEIAELQTQLYQEIQAYALEYTSVAIVYDEHKYPYFFADISGDGEADEQYKNWTPRMLKAAYNFHASKKDKGSYTHNLKYVSQLLQTSIDDIKSVL